LSALNKATETQERVQL